VRPSAEGSKTRAPAAADQNKNKRGKKNKQVTTATIAVRRNQNLARQKTEIRLGPTSAGLLGIIAVVVLALLYLNQVTKTTVFGYKVSDLSAKHDKLTDANQELKVEAARLQSIKEIQQSNTVKTMTAPASVTYAH
jgi:FAD/FMN-containing dehydrogenase